MRFWLILSVFCSSGLCFDFFLETIPKTVNWSSDPCEDFYRHVCPIGSVSDPLAKAVNSRRNAKQAASKIDHFKYLAHLAYGGTNGLAQRAGQLYEKRCEQGLDNQNLFSILKTLVVFDGHCYGVFCTDHLKLDTDCKRVGKIIRNTLPAFEVDIQKKRVEKLECLVLAAHNYMTIQEHVDQELEEAIMETNALVGEMKEIVKEMILATPWAANNNVIKSTLGAVLSTNLEVDFEKIKKNLFDQLTKIHLNYEECRNQFNNDNDANILCFWNSIDKHEFDKTYIYFEHYDLSFNAVNSFPNIYFGLPFYFIVKHTEELAAVLGSTGYIVGHELSHTLISSDNFPALTYFSQSAIDCIQKQFNSTCTEFKEESCLVQDVHLDENGADILGFQLAYSVLEKHYGNRLKDTYTPLNVTHQQLFFYSAALISCEGKKGEVLLNRDRSLNGHSPSNIRINSIAQHPGFKEAFQCSDNSRMMQSATEQCHIYGKDAPVSRRR